MIINNQSKRGDTSLSSTLNSIKPGPKAKYLSFDLFDDGAVRCFIMDEHQTEVQPSVEINTFKEKYKNTAEENILTIYRQLKKAYQQTSLGKSHGVHAVFMYHDTDTVYSLNV